MHGVAVMMGDDGGGRWMLLWEPFNCVCVFFFLLSLGSEWDAVNAWKKPSSILLKWRLMTRWQTARELKLLLHMWRAPLAPGKNKKLKKNKKKIKFEARPSTQTSPCGLPGDDRRCWGLLASPPALFDWWLVPGGGGGGGAVERRPRWARTSNSLMSYMWQPTGCSGRRCLPDILLLDRQG